LQRGEYQQEYGSYVFFIDHLFYSDNQTLTNLIEKKPKVNRGRIMAGVCN